MLGLVLMATTAIAFYLCYLLATPFLSSLLWALAIAVVVHPVHGWLERKVGRPALAAGLAVVMVVILIVGPALFVTQQIVQQITSDAEEIPKRLAALCERFPWLTPLRRSLVQGEVPKEVQNAIATQLPGYLSGSLWAGAQLLITVFFLFYFFRDRRTWMNELRGLLPLSRDETTFAFARIKDTIFATIYGSLTVALVQGAMGGFMFWMLGLPSALLWGVVMGVMAVLPMLGTFVVWMPAAIFLATSGEWGRAAILVAWGSTAIALVDNLLYPVLVGSRLRLHPLLVFISIVGGLTVFGMAGIILGPVTLSISDALIEVWKRRFVVEDRLETSDASRPA